MSKPTPIPPPPPTPRGIDLGLGQRSAPALPSGIPTIEQIEAGPDKIDAVFQKDRAKKERDRLQAEEKRKRDALEPIEAMMEFSKRVGMLGDQKNIDSEFEKFQADREKRGVQRLEFKGFGKGKDGFVQIFNLDNDEDDPGGSFYGFGGAKTPEDFMSGAREDQPPPEFAKKFMEATEFRKSLVAKGTDQKTLASFDREMFKEPTKFQQVLETVETLAEMERTSPETAKFMMRQLNMLSEGQKKVDFIEDVHEAWRTETDPIKKQAFALLLGGGQSEERFSRFKTELKGIDDEIAAIRKSLRNLDRDEVDGTKLMVGDKLKALREKLDLQVNGFLEQREELLRSANNFGPLSERPRDINEEVKREKVATLGDYSLLSEDDELNNVPNSEEFLEFLKVTRHSKTDFDKLSASKKRV